MDFGLGTFALAFLAGAATLLSPCVLPLLPILLASAMSRHRWGAAMLALGLSLSFALAGTVLASVGASAGLDPRTFRRIAAWLMLLFGLVMLLPPLQRVFERMTARVGNTGQQALGGVRGGGVFSQLSVGLLLGLVWSPCVGPTLGAATTLAAQGRHLPQIALLMVVFGLGAGLPLLVLSTVSGAAMTRARGALVTLGMVAKRVLGGCFVLIGLLVLSGFDRRIEALLLGVSPDWLTRLTTSL
ncbi:cytochrome c biogenesis protein CcdA [Dyella solisilvae]|uniref:Cytochrome c biogenesis protein CcdA n=1 Tax=Dyella solisilvae TaxID=1920168 RepID=A0A370K495_9GAMM|nr:cytochrome c biogenesis protein CcdA [Dyella solisilvae]RDI97476.1 cytochrome c biogenesis protein CcdA [Dyella solisilvae]